MGQLIYITFTIEIGENTNVRFPLYRNKAIDLQSIGSKIASNWLFFNFFSNSIFKQSCRSLNRTATAGV